MTVPSSAICRTCGCTDVENVPFFLFRLSCERVVFAGIGGLASGQEPQTVEKFFILCHI